MMSKKGKLSSKRWLISWDKGKYVWDLSHHKGRRMKTRKKLAVAQDIRIQRKWLPRIFLDPPKFDVSDFRTWISVSRKSKGQ